MYCPEFILRTTSKFPVHFVPKESAKNYDDLPKFNGEINTHANIRIAQIAKSCQPVRIRTNHIISVAGQFSCNIALYEKCF
jgi:hypothetical protein